MAVCREAASDWGLQCMRYEIRDISPPAGVRAAMELQVSLLPQHVSFKIIACLSGSHAVILATPCWPCIVATGTIWSEQVCTADAPQLSAWQLTISAVLTEEHEQAEAERRKRAQILESEGARQSKINVAEGDKAQVILTSEAAKQDAINRAVGACWLSICQGSYKTRSTTICPDKVF